MIFPNFQSLEINKKRMPVIFTLLLFEQNKQQQHLKKLNKIRVKIWFIQSDLQSL